MSRRLGAVLLAALAAALAPAAAAETPKLILPEQYQGRIVAPRKGRVLLVSFWATWCEPCREELPELARAARRFRARDLAVVLVSLDSAKTGQGPVARFLAAQKVPFVCWIVKARDDADFIGAVDKEWDGAIPFTVIYGRGGKPAKKLLGRQSEKSFAEAIRSALGN